MTDKVLVPVEQVIEQCYMMPNLGSVSRYDVGWRDACKWIQDRLMPTPDLAALEKQAAIEWATRELDFMGAESDKGWLRLFGSGFVDRKDKWNRACTILEANKLLERHSDVVKGGNPGWVRIRESE